jgi:hypothetical protein
MRQVNSDAIGPNLSNNKSVRMDIKSICGKNEKGVYWQVMSQSAVTRIPYHSRRYYVHVPSAFPWQAISGQCWPGVLRSPLHEESAHKGSGMAESWEQFIFSGKVMLSYG